MGGSNLEEIAILRLEKEEKYVFRLVHAPGNDHEPTVLVFQDMLPAGDRAAQLGLVEVLPGDVVFRAHQHTRGPVRASRDGDEEIGAIVNRVAPLAHNVVETEVELVVRQHLLHRVHSLASRVLIGLCKVHFEACKHGVLKAHIDTLSPPPGGET